MVNAGWTELNALPAWQCRALLCDAELAFRQTGRAGSALALRDRLMVWTGQA
jgi:hypothetical protein